jgi:hypothetical protein
LKNGQNASRSGNISAPLVIKNSDADPMKGIHHGADPGNIDAHECENNIVTIANARTASG